jgi:hypothetical protein
MGNPVLREMDDDAVENNVSSAFADILDMVDMHGGPAFSIAISIWIASLPAPLRELLDEAIEKAQTTVANDPGMKPVGLNS